KLRSATSFRSFVFSSRSCLASCAWLTSMPPYFAFQAYSVCLDTPTSRATSSTFRPASTCFSAPIICASVCLLFDIPRSPFFRTNHTQLCAETGEQVRLGPKGDFPFSAHTHFGLGYPILGDKPGTQQTGDRRDVLCRARPHFCNPPPDFFHHKRDVLAITDF